MTNALKQVTVLDTRQTVNDKYTQWQWADSTDVVFKDSTPGKRSMTSTHNGSGLIAPM